MHTRTYQDDCLDVAAGEAEGASMPVIDGVTSDGLGLVETGEHFVDNVGLGVRGTPAPLYVVVDDLVDEPVKRPA